MTRWRARSPSRHIEQERQQQRDAIAGRLIDRTQLPKCGAPCQRSTVACGRGFSPQYRCGVGEFRHRSVHSRGRTLEILGEAGGQRPVIVQSEQESLEVVAPGLRHEHIADRVLDDQIQPMIQAISSPNAAYE